MAGKTGTAQMIANFVAGGAAINVLAEAAGASLTVVDVGVASSIATGPPDVNRRVRLLRLDLQDQSVHATDADRRAFLDRCAARSAAPQRPLDEHGRRQA